MNLFFRQRSSKSSKKNPSRQATGKTLTTNRCVSSPLSIQGKSEKQKPKFYIYYYLRRRSRKTFSY